VDSQLVRSILRSLVQHGVFEIDSTPGSQNPLRLCREDDQAQGIVTCLINYSSSHGDTEDGRVSNRYDRNKIGCILPSSVRAACELLANLSSGDARMSFDGADVKRERKTIRFSWSVRINGNFQYKFNYDKVSVEIAWTAKDDGASLIPSPEEAAANQRQQDGAAAELRISADVAALRLACAEEINSTSTTKSVPLHGTAFFADPPKHYSYHPAAIEQVIAELDAKGWKAEPLGPGLATGMYFLNIERK